MELIATTQALAETCTRLAAQPFVTVDTEFMRETTYYPKLCLIQMAGPDGTACLVDPLAQGIDLQPFLDLMADESVVKVFHSARQDLEIIWLMGGLLPHPFFDTQVAAMVCGYGDSVSYEQLVNDVAKARIDKSSRFTDWSRRPLSEAQLAYALSDVTHLVTIYQVLAAELLRTDRGLWLDEEMAVLTSPETYRADPAFAWKRLSGRMRKPREIAVLMEVAGWREAEAQSRNVPRGAHPQGRGGDRHRHRRPPQRRGVGAPAYDPGRFERSRTGGEILAAVERGFARDLSQIAIPERARTRGGNNGALVDLLKVLLKAVAEAEGVAPKIIATVDDLEALAEDGTDDLPVLQGWRRGLFGDKALALKAGRMALSVERGRVVVRDVPAL